MTGLLVFSVVMLVIAYIKLWAELDGVKSERDSLRFFRSRIAREIQYGYADGELCDRDLLGIAAQTKHTLMAQDETIRRLGEAAKAEQLRQERFVLSARGIDPRRDALWDRGGS